MADKKTNIRIRLCGDTCSIPKGQNMNGKNTEGSEGQGSNLKINVSI